VTPYVSSSTPPTKQAAHAHENAKAPDTHQHTQGVYLLINSVVRILDLLVHDGTLHMRRSYNTVDTH